MKQRWNGELLQVRYCFIGGAPKLPTPLPVPQVEQQLDTAGQQANAAERAHRRATAGLASTYLTSGGGVQSAANLGKTSLGA